MTSSERVMDFCPDISVSSYLVPFDAESTYRTGSATTLAQQLIPRWGLSRNVTSFLYGDIPAEAEDYMVGVLATGALIFSLVAFWLLTLIVLELLGPQQVGFFSGFMLKPSPEGLAFSVCSENTTADEIPVDDDEEYSELSSKSSSSAEYESSYNDSEVQSSAYTSGMSSMISTPAPSCYRDPRSSRYSRVSSHESFGDALAPPSVNRRAWDALSRQSSSFYSSLRNPKSHQSSKGVIPKWSDLASFATKSQKSDWFNLGRQSEDDTSTTDSSLSSKGVPSSSSSHHSPWKHAKKVNVHEPGSMRRFRRQLRFARFMVLFSGFGIVLGAILFTGLGAREIQQSLNVASHGMPRIESMLQVLSGLLHLLAGQHVATRTDASGFLDQFGAVCSTQVCEDSQILSGCVFDNLPFASQLEALVESAKGSHFLYEVSVARQSFVDAVVNLGDILETTDSFRWAYWVAAVFSLILSAVTIYTLGNCMLRWYWGQRTISRSQQRVQRWLVAPTFLFLVALSWVFSMIFIMGTIVTTDVCREDPDTVMAAILETSRDRMDPTMHDFLSYVVSHCSATEVPHLITNVTEVLVDYADAVDGMYSSLLETTTQQVQQCGSDPSVLDADALLLTTKVCNLATTWQASNKIVSCDNWYPIYETIVHEGLCHHATRGLAWMTFSSLLIVFCALTMLTFRVAFYASEPVSRSRPSREYTSSMMSI